MLLRLCIIISLLGIHIMHVIVTLSLKIFFLSNTKDKEDA